MSDTHFSGVDSTNGYKVGGTEVIDSSGNVIAGAGSISNSEMGVPCIRVIQETFALADMTDGGSAVATYDLATAIPKGAVVMQSFLDAITGFAGDTSATIQLGDGTDVDRYSTGTPNVFATADHISAGAVSGTAYHSAAKTPKATITAGSEWGSVTAGQVTITIFYYQSV